LSEQGEAKSRAEVLGIQQGSGQFRKGGSALSGSEENFLLEGVEADGKEKTRGEGDRAGDGQAPEGGLQE
jgi:hypothetical protein